MKLKFLLLLSFLCLGFATGIVAIARACPCARSHVCCVCVRVFVLVGG